MDKVQFNNQMVLMRKVIKRVKVRLVNQLTRQVRICKKKKGSVKQLEKNARRADRLITEIEALKDVNSDEITKTAVRRDCPTMEVINDVNSSAEERAIARLVNHYMIVQQVSKYKDLVTADLLDIGKMKKRKLVKERAIERAKMRKTEKKTKIRQPTEIDENLEQSSLLKESSNNFEKKNLSLKNKSEDMKNSKGNNSMGKTNKNDGGKNVKLKRLNGDKNIMKVSLEDDKASKRKNSFEEEENDNDDSDDEDDDGDEDDDDEDNNGSVDHGEDVGHSSDDDDGSDDEDEDLQKRETRKHNSGVDKKNGRLSLKEPGSESDGNSDSDDDNEEKSNSKFVENSSSSDKDDSEDERFAESKWKTNFFENALGNKTNVSNKLNQKDKLQTKVKEQMKGQRPKGSVKRNVDSTFVGTLKGEESHESSDDDLEVKRLKPDDGAEHKRAAVFSKKIPRVDQASLSSASKKEKKVIPGINDFFKPSPAPQKQKENPTSTFKKTTFNTKPVREKPMEKDRPKPNKPPSQVTSHVDTGHKLHPSWEAKKKQKEQLTFQAFQGKKIVFDD